MVGDRRKHIVVGVVVVVVIVASVVYVFVVVTIVFVVIVVVEVMMKPGVDRSNQVFFRGLIRCVLASL